MYPTRSHGPGDGSVVGIDRGVAVSAALSTGELLHAPGLTPGESKRLNVLQQRLAAQRGSNRRAIAKLKSLERERRNDWIEKTTTDLARRFDVIRVEALHVRAMTRSARGAVEKPGMRVAHKRGLNRAISRSGWVSSSHRETARAKRSSSAEACTAGPCNADASAARNIAAGRAVTAQGRPRRWAVCEP